MNADAMNTDTMNTDTMNTDAADTHAMNTDAASDDEPVENALQAIDRYVAEAPASQPRSEAEPLSLSQRLQVLGQRNVGTFTPLADFQNAPPVADITTPLLPNEF